MITYLNRKKNHALRVSLLIYSDPLRKMFDLSSATGHRPYIFKISKIIPIFKKGSRLPLCNYRPISLLSNLNKIHEKLVF